MPRARATAARLQPPVEALEPSGSELDEEPLVDAEDVEDVESAFTQIEDQEATVTIKRRDPVDATKWDYLTVVPARAFSLERIKAEYGGGEYKATALDKHRRYLKRQTFYIDRSFKPSPPASPAGAPPEQGRTSPPEVAALTAKVDHLTALLQAQNSTKETLDMALKIAAVMRGAGGGGGMSMDNMFTLFDRALDYTKKLNPEGGEGGDETDVYGAAVKELVRPVARFLETEVERRAAIKRAATVAALPPGSKTPPTEEVSTVGTVPPWLGQLRPFLPQLIALAKENADPDLYADVVYDVMERKLPAAQLAAVEEAAKGAGFVETVMAALPPACGAYSEWFRHLLGRLKVVLTAPPSPGEDDEEEEAGSAAG